MTLWDMLWSLNSMFQLCRRVYTIGRKLCTPSEDDILQYLLENILEEKFKELKKE